MKKMFFATLALLAALSCSKEEEPKPQVPSSAPEFTVEIDNTRIVDAKSGKEFSYAWTKDALVSVFYNTAGNTKYKFTGNAGDVSGNIAAVSAAEGDVLTTAYAIYPYAASTTFDNDTFFFTLPTNQTYTGVGLGVDSNIMVAKQIEDGSCDFKFKNVSGYISLRLYGTAKIAKINLTGNNNETLTGNAVYDMYSDEFIILDEGQGGTITLNCNQDITLGLTENTATPFMFAIPPTTFEKGFTVTITDTEGKSVEQSFDTAFTVGRNGIHSETMVWDSSISRAQAEEMISNISKEWITATKAKYAEAIAQNVFTHKGLQLKIWATTYGEKPADGRSLYISMHGGGSGPAATNDSQWNNQKYLYTPTEGVYVAPRAPWNEWNMWFKEGLDELFEQLIQAAVATWDVSPDKVYLMGYSAGGDGAYKMGPRMADRWAAASMMAGHPNGTSMLSLRNTPFSIWVGANDSSYNRNTVAAEYGKILDDLQAADPEGYIHSTHIVAGKGHWMDNEDRAAVPWMAQFKRNPYPTKVVWRQAEVKRTSFYWLSIDPEEYKNGATIIAEIDGNTINVSQCDYKYVYFHLNDKMVDLDKPVVIRLNNSEVFNGMLERSRANMESTLEARGDIRYIFPAVVKVKMANNGALESPDNGDNIEW